MRRVPAPILISLCALLVGACAAAPDPAGERLRQVMEINVTPVAMKEGEAEVSYSAEVILARAEGHFNDKEYAEAAQEYNRFMELHAAHPWGAYALFRKGLSYERQAKTPDRDPGYPEQARQAFANLVANYPNSPALADARAHLAWADNQLALHELGVARFYRRTHRPHSALERLNHLFEQYSDTAAARSARFLLGQVMEEIKDPDGARAAYEAFLSNPGDDATPRTLRRAQKALVRLRGG